MVLFDLNIFLPFIIIGSRNPGLVCLMNLNTGEEATFGELTVIVLG